MAHKNKTKKPKLVQRSDHFTSDSAHASLLLAGGYYRRIMPYNSVSISQWEHAYIVYKHKPYNKGNYYNFSFWASVELLDVK